MSRCRCSDIKRLKRDITTLKEALSIGEGFCSVNDSIQDGLDSVAGGANQITMSQFVMDCEAHTVTLHCDMGNTKDSAKWKIKGKKSELEDKLSDYQDEDKKYHERKKKHKK